MHETSQVFPEVTVGRRDAAVELTRMYLQRVTPGDTWLVSGNDSMLQQSSYMNNIDNYSIPELGCWAGFDSSTYRSDIPVAAIRPQHPCCSSACRILPSNRGKHHAVY